MVMMLCIRIVYHALILVAVVYYGEPMPLKCSWKVGGTGDNTCPRMIEDDSDWQCFSSVLNCSDGLVYHCLRNERGEWTEVCAKEEMCEKGKEPMVTNVGNIVCRYCHDPERYNPEKETLSNKLSQCPNKKTVCKKEKNDRIECEQPYDKDDPNSKYKMNRQCRCSYEENMVPKDYDSDRDTWTCSFDVVMECSPRPCPMTDDGKNQIMGKGYKCYPVANVSPVPSTSAIAFNKSETYPRTVETTTVTINSTVSTPLTTTEGDKAQENKQVVGIVVGVIFGGLAAVIVVVVLIRHWKRSKNKAKAKIAMPVGPLEVNDIKYRDLKLSWNAPNRTHLRSHTEPLVINYHVEKRQANLPEWTYVGSYQTNDTSISYQVTGLEPDTVYEFRVKAESRGKLSLPLTTQRTYKTNRLTENEISCMVCKRTHRPLKPTPAVIRGCYKRVININLPKLKEDMDPVDTLDCIKKKNILTGNQYSNIEATNDRCEKNERILKFMQMKGFEGYEDFKTILHETNQLNLVYALEETETIIENEDFETAV